jgi:hypothetical protein
LVGLADSISGIDPGRTRPLCPFPLTAIYNGSGSTDDFHSFTCGGNLNGGVIKNGSGVAIEGISSACNDVKTVYGQEDSANLDYKNVGLTASQCAPYLPPPHVGTTAQP